jgi:formate hydrogenlyase subunit 3/multisubunit Na+/H+ antiporter MnhD subunit
MFPPAGEGLLAFVLLYPLLIALLAQVGSARQARTMIILAMPAALLLQMMLALRLLRAGMPSELALPMVDLLLRADGMAVVMMLVALLVVAAVAIWAEGMAQDECARLFWRLLPAQWAILNGVFVASDLFTTYLGLELLAFAAMPLFCLDRRPEQLAAALRYLLFAAIGSALYLLGAAILLRSTGTLTLSGIGAHLAAGGAAHGAAALMTAGLLAKTALFPLHAWLPPAHAGAPPAVSAVHSALVVKGSFVLLLRLWGEAPAQVVAGPASALLAMLGVCAIIFGSTLALTQSRLKLLVAWSTVAQIGYLFLVFPMLAGEGGGRAWTGALLQAASHALAKAAMFLAGGQLAALRGDDRIDGLEGLGQVAPLAVTAFAVGGFSLMGLPPSGGFTAKWLLLTACMNAGQWWWAVAIVGGGLLTGGYVYRVLRTTLTPGGDVLALPARSASQGAVALGLALLSLLPGLLPLGAFGLLTIGAPALTPAAA